MHYTSLDDLTHSPVQIRVTHSKVKRVYRVLEVAAKGANSILMYIHDAKSATTSRWTVEHYFLHFYGVTLQYPSLNCIHVAPKHRLIFLPMEVLSNSLIVCYNDVW